MISTTDHPYELHQQGGGFTVFESGDAFGLPIGQLNMASLKGAGGQTMNLDFDSAQVVVEGDNLSELFGHILAGRVKTIRRGRHGTCVVGKVQVVAV